MKANTILTVLLSFILLSTSCKKESVAPVATNADAASLTNTNEPVIVYPFCKIGSQKWMSKNLDVNRFANGERIPECKSSKKWAKLTTPAWCWYNFDSVHYAEYGKLYNFYAVHDLRGLAPKGWHVASNDEWLTLYSFLIADNPNDGVWGGQLKEAGFTHWEAPNLGATDKYGFSALGGGFISGEDGVFHQNKILGMFWTSTIFNFQLADCELVRYDGGNMDIDVDAFYDYGFSVRCIKNSK